MQIGQNNDKWDDIEHCHSESNQTHPALRNWDALPESHRRSPDFNQKEITEWLRNLI